MSIWTFEINKLLQQTFLMIITRFLDTIINSVLTKLKKNHFSDKMAHDAFQYLLKMFFKCQWHQVAFISLFTSQFTVLINHLFFINVCFSRPTSPPWSFHSFGSMCVLLHLKFPHIFIGVGNNLSRSCTQSVTVYL